MESACPSHVPRHAFNDRQIGDSELTVGVNGGSFAFAAGRMLGLAPAHSKVEDDGWIEIKFECQNSIFIQKESENARC